MNRDHFRRLAEIRLEDATALLAAGRFDAAYYLAGYVVECALKACVCRKTREFDFPVRDAAKYYQHDLKLLSTLAGIENEFAEAREVDQTLAENWNLVQDWKEDRRYAISGAGWEMAAKNLIQAISGEEHGVLQWLSKYW